MVPEQRSNIIEELIKAHFGGHLIPTYHAQLRMVERNITLSDIEEAILNSQRETAKDKLTDDGADWIYHVRGKTNDGEKDIRIAFFFDDPRAIIVTVIDLEA